MHNIVRGDGASLTEVCGISVNSAHRHAAAPLMRVSSSLPRLSSRMITVVA